MVLFIFKVNELKFIVLLKFIVATTAGTPALSPTKKRLLEFEIKVLYLSLLLELNFSINRNYRGILIKNRY
jgi:hypothetical protein